MINMFEVYKFESLSKDDKLTVILIILIGILIFIILCWLMFLYISALKGKAKKLGINHKEQITKVIRKIKNNNCKVGISVKPETDIKEICEFLPYVHMCLVMTVEPGKGGQTLLKDMVNKIAELKEYIQKNNLEVDIEADGGINLTTAEAVKKAGANILVSGTAILMAKDYKVIIDDLRA